MNADGSLSYDGPDGVTLVTGSGEFCPEYAAMHFGDEPQSVPKFFYDFLVANADYMSKGFGMTDFLKDTEGTDGSHWWLTSHLRQNIIGTPNVYNTLNDALPEDFKAVLSPIPVYNYNLNDYSSESDAYASLPYANEVINYGLLQDTLLAQ
jgi:hypothetical protein